MRRALTLLFLVLQGDCLRLGRRAFVALVGGGVVGRADAAEIDERAALDLKLAERRQLMRAGRSTSSRQEILDLSRQRAAVVFNTTSRAANCDNKLGLPCL